MSNYKKNLFATLMVSIICLSILVSFNLVSANPGAPTINVHKGDSIQAAINSANSGAKIFVHKGIYIISEPIHVNKAVELIGKGATIEYTKTNYVGANGGAAFFVETDGVRISGFIIHTEYGPGAPANVGYLAGINVGDAALHSATYCTIDNNIIDSPSWGVSGFKTTGVIVKDNVISAQHPMWFTYATDITIDNNVVTAKNYPTSPVINPAQQLFGAMAGIKLPGCYGAVISNNQITSENYGMLIIFNQPQIPSNILITGNQILSSTNGIYTDKGMNFEVTDNIVNAQFNGIWLNDMQGTPAIVVDNTVTCGLTAVYVGNAAP
jgi:hypothetical protein